MTTFIQVLFSAGSIIILGLGSLHLKYTFYSDRFSPKNAEVETGMKATHPRLTKDTTMWNAWIGFNASHSLGAIFFGLINLLLVWDNFSYYSQSIPLQVLNLASLLYFLLLAKRYWFRIPFRGVAISTICFAVATGLLLRN